MAERTRRAGVPPAQALAWLEQAAEALDAAHDEGIVHRDVKPANLLFNARGEITVADFGIARVLDETTGGMTATGTILGTSGYLSPEQARGEEATAASDIYSLAVVAYELLTGSRPFQRSTATAEAAAHIHEPVPSASGIAHSLPREIDDVFARALAKDPAERHETARELVEDLRAALAAGEEITEAIAAPAARTKPVRRAAATVTPPHRRSRIPWLLPAVIGVLALAGGILAAALLAGGDDEADRRVAPRIVTRTYTAPGTTATRERTVFETVTTPPEEEEEPEPPPPPPPATTPPPSPPVAADGHTLNDRGFALQQEGRYEEALPLLQQAVVKLRGVGPADPYEAYANYNLGYTLIQLGRCREALAPLRRSDQLQDHPDLDRALKQAEKCA